jgi:hypothetical protein
LNYTSGTSAKLEEIPAALASTLASSAESPAPS